MTVRTGKSVARVVGGGAFHTENSIEASAIQEAPGVVVLDLYDADQSGDNSVTLNVANYLQDGETQYKLRAPIGEDALVNASLEGSIITISVPEDSTAAGLTAVSVVSTNADGLPVSWTVLVHVVSVDGYTVEEQAWGEGTWDSPEDSGDDWSLLWQCNDYRWKPQTTFDGLTTAADWSFGSAQVDASRDRWTYANPSSTGEFEVTPTVAFGGETPYFETLNTASVGLHREEAPSAAQPRIAATYVSYMDWEAAYFSSIETDRYGTVPGAAKLTTADDGYVAYPGYRYHPEVPEPIDHNIVRLRVELGEAVPQGMTGTLHLAWYDPDNTVANVPSTAPENMGNGIRDNDAALAAASGRLPGWTLCFSPEDPVQHPDSTTGSVQDAFLVIDDGRYGDNFIVVAHPNEGIAESLEFRENEAEELELMRRANTGLWHALPDDGDHSDDPADGVKDHRTSVLTILPSVDIDADSDNNGPIERTADEEDRESDPDEPGKIILLNDDDDNHNDVLDMDELDGNGAPSVYANGDNDLTQVVLDFGLATYQGLAGCTLELTSSDGLRVWGDWRRNLPADTSAYNLAHTLYAWTITSETLDDPFPPSVYVEGISSGRETVTWALIGPDQEVLHSDTIVFTVVRADLDADTNRDNAFDDTDEAFEDDWTNAHGAIILANADDDDRDGVPDNWGGGALVDAIATTSAGIFINAPARWPLPPGDDLADIGKLIIPQLDVAQLPDDLTIELKIESIDAGVFHVTPEVEAKKRVRIFLPTDRPTGSTGYECKVGDSELLGPTIGTTVTFSKSPADPRHKHSIFQGTGNVAFGIEGIYPGAPVQITATFMLGGTVLRADVVQVKVSPFIAFSHEAEVALGASSNPTVYVAQNASNAPLRTALSVYGSSLATVPTTQEVSDQWWQDPFEIGYLQSPYGQMHALLMLPRSTKKHPPTSPGATFYDYARNNMMRDSVGFLPYFAGFDLDDIGSNAGGNFEVRTGTNALRNSFGTIVMAIGNGHNPIDPRIANFLLSQGVQTVIATIDLSWMKLGHIDEIVSFSTTPGGRARVASPEVAWALLTIAQKGGGGSEVILTDMTEGDITVDNLLTSSAPRDYYGDIFDGPLSYSEQLQFAFSRLGFHSPITQAPVSGNGAPEDVLHTAGYLDAYDHLFHSGDEVEWKLQFTGPDTYDFYCRKVGTVDWTPDGSGNRREDSVSTSMVAFVLRAWWDDSKMTAAGQTVLFKTKPSPDMIALPVLFRDDGNTGAVAYTNNVVNALVDGEKLFVAEVRGPTVGGGSLFDWYVQDAALTVGFLSVTTCDEALYYHNNYGSIHCGTNVFRVIPYSWWECMVS